VKYTKIVKEYIGTLIERASLGSAALLFPACLLALSAHAQSLEIYFIDVEGGQSTLVVTPTRESLLIDTCFAGKGRNTIPGK